jgi:hypothetical protein
MTALEESSTRLRVSEEVHIRSDYILSLRPSEGVCAGQINPIDGLLFTESRCGASVPMGKRWPAGLTEAP